MKHRYRALVALTSLLLVCAAAPPRRTARTDANLRASDIYSPRALRRARTILHLKLLELRQARLERIRRALERGLPIDQILKIP